MHKTEHGFPKLIRTLDWPTSTRLSLNMILGLEGNSWDEIGM